MQALKCVMKNIHDVKCYLKVKGGRRAAPYVVRRGRRPGRGMEVNR